MGNYRHFRLGQILRLTTGRSYSETPSNLHMHTVVSADSRCCQEWADGLWIMVTDHPVYLDLVSAATT